jgi:IMP dehydrogenase
MASEEAQLAFKGAVQNGIAEGVAKTVPHKGSVWPVIQALLGGIRSGMSYSGARTLQELRECAKFIDVSTNTLIENHPHGKNQ